MLLFSSGMARIPTEVLEAAKLDGVGPGTEITKIIIPLIWPTFTTQFILAFTGLFQAGGPILLLTQGQHNTYTFAFWMLSKIIGPGGNGGGNAGSPDQLRLISAMGIACTLVAVPIVFFTRWLCGKVDTIEY
jgi:ABC-type sugar transport system permease subunit